MNYKKKHREPDIFDCEPDMGRQSSLFSPLFLLFPDFWRKNGRFSPLYGFSG